MSSMNPPPSLSHHRSLTHTASTLFQAPPQHFTLLPCAYSNYGNITSILVYQDTVYVGTDSTHLLKFDLELHEEEEADDENDELSQQQDQSINSSPIDNEDDTSVTGAHASTGLRNQSHTWTPSGSPLRGKKAASYRMSPPESPHSPLSSTSSSFLPQSNSFSTTDRLRPSLNSASIFGMTAVRLGVSLDARKHHNRTKGSAITQLMLCPSLGVILALADGVLCAYDLITLRFQQRITAPTGNQMAGIDRVAVFPFASASMDFPALQQTPPLPRSNSKVMSFTNSSTSLLQSNNAYAFVSLALCVGKKLFILQRSTDATTESSASSTTRNLKSTSASTQLQQLALASNQWSVQQELILPEPALSCEWQDAVSLLVGFKNEYSIMNSITGDSLELLHLPSNSGEPITHRLSFPAAMSSKEDRSLRLIHSGQKALLHVTEGNNHVLADALLYANTPISIAVAFGGLYAFVLDPYHAHVYRQTQPGVWSWRVSQNLVVSGASRMATDGAALTVLSKGAQLYILQPMYPTDKQRDTLMMMQLRSNFWEQLAAPSSAPLSGHTVRWTREEASSAVSSHVQRVMYQRTHPFSVMCRCFVVQLKRTINEAILKASLNQSSTDTKTSGSSGATGTNSPKVLPPPLVVTASSGSIVASAIAPPPTAGAELAAGISSLPPIPSIPPSTFEVSTFPTPSNPPTISLERRNEILEIIREFQQLVIRCMKVSWHEACNVVQPKNKPPVAASVSGNSSNTNGAAAAASAAPTDFLSECCEVFDHTLFKLLHSSLFPLYAGSTRTSDEEFHAACKRLISISSTPETFGSSIVKKSPWIAQQLESNEKEGQKFDLYSEILSCYAPSIKLFDQLSLLKTPAEKLAILTDVHYQLLKDSQKLYDPSTGGKQFVMSADELLPILCFALLHSTVGSPFAETDYMLDFLGESASLGAHGYTLTTLQMGLQLIVQTATDPLHQQVTSTSETSFLEGGQPTQYLLNLPAEERIRTLEFVQTLYDQFDLLSGDTKVRLFSLYDASEAQWYSALPAIFQRIQQEIFRSIMRETDSSANSTLISYLEAAQFHPTNIKQDIIKAAEQFLQSSGDTNAPPALPSGDSSLMATPVVSSSVSASPFVAASPLQIPPPASSETTTTTVFSSHSSSRISAHFTPSSFTSAGSSPTGSAAFTGGAVATLAGANSPAVSSVLSLVRGDSHTSSQQAAGIGSMILGSSSSTASKSPDMTPSMGLSPLVHPRLSRAVSSNSTFQQIRTSTSSPPALPSPASSPPRIHASQKEKERADREREKEVRRTSQSTGDPRVPGMLMSVEMRDLSLARLSDRQDDDAQDEAYDSDPKQTSAASPALAPSTASLHAAAATSNRRLSGHPLVASSSSNNLSSSFSQQPVQPQEEAILLVAEPIHVDNHFSA